MTIENKYLEVLDNLGWAVSDVSSDNRLDIKKRSPAGEDYCFTVYADYLVEDVNDKADFFDVDKHVLLWVNKRGICGVPGTIRELLDDAEAIKAMLNELADALEAVQ